MDREKALAAQRSEYDDLTAKLRASDERRMQLSARWTAAPAHHRIPAQGTGRAPGPGAVHHAADRRPGRPGGRRKSIADGNVRVQGLQGEIDRLHREIAALGAVNLAALDELNLARERKVFLDAQTADLTEGHEHAGRRDPQDRRRNAPAAVGHV